MDFRNSATPGALRAMLNYYRAYVRERGMKRQRKRGYPLVESPTLMIWGEQDAALGKELTFGTEQHVKEFTLRYVPNASHWVQQDAPDTVNEMLRAWLSGEIVPEASSMKS